MPETSPYSPDKNLPPVEAPTVGFLMKLFFIPGIIVSVIVGVWMLFTWLAHMGSDPAQELKTLRGNSSARWHAAHNLAHQLASDKAGRYTGDPALCREMAQIFDVELNGGSMQTDSLEIRKYLATALRIFTVDDGVPTLISAAKTRRELTELPVQAEAFDSFGVLTHRFCPVGTNVARDSWKYYPEVRDLTLALADDSEPEIRERAAFHLAEFPEPAATEKLKKLLEDGKLETRFNAGTSLAMRGDAAALPVLEEMLRIQQDDLLPKVPAGEEPTPKQTAEAKQRRLLILNTAGDSVVTFHKANPTADLATIIAAMQKLREEGNPELTQFIDGKLAQLNAAK